MKRLRDLGFGILDFGLGARKEQSQIPNPKSQICCIGLCALLTAVSCTSSPERGAEAQMHVVVIGVDGMSPDGIRHAETPHLDALIAGGAHSFKARGVLPTSSSPNWASMINGAGPEQHGITSNAWQLDHYSIEPTATGVGPIFPTVFDLLSRQKPEAVSASIYDWSGFGRLYNKEAVPIDIDADGPQAAADAAVRVFGEQAPVFTFIHLDHVDGAGHGQGHGTPAYYAAVAEADRYIGEILAGLEAAGLRERTTVIVTADHGGIGKGHGGESMAEVEIPWIINGPEVAAGTEIDEPINTYDTAATVAHLLGLEPPYAWIARPVYGAFKKGERPAPPALGQEDIAHVVVIGIDAFSPDGIQKAHTPVLNRMLPNSAFSFTARGVLTTSSSQNWASMIMGAGPEQHGITSNDWERDNFSIVPTAAGPEDLFPTIFAELRAAEPGAYIASIYDWGGFGRLFPHSVVDVSIDAEGPQDAVDKAREQFNQHQPRLTFIHLDHVDHAGHTYGHGSDAFYASVEEADRLIGEIMTGLEEAGMAAQTLVIISADHGGVGKGHGGESMAELEIPWIVHGPGVVAGKHLTDPIDTYDTAATVLFALDVPQPDAWIARPVVSAFERYHEASAPLGMYVPAPRIIPLGGIALRNEAPTVTMTVDDPEAEIRYTLDGSTPDATSSLYEGAFPVAGNTRVQAITVKAAATSTVSRADYRVVAPGQEKKVSYAYYEGEWEVLPDFDQLQPVRTGRAYEFHLEGVEGRREDHFGMRFEGIIQVDQAGVYTFYTRSDDGTKLYVDGTEVVDNDGSHGALEESGEITLEPGRHTVVVTYFENGGGEHLEVLYHGPGVERQMLSYEVFQNALLK